MTEARTSAGGQKPCTACATVTIVVPALNERDYIAACLASLQEQDYPQDALEILVLDGGSTDGSPDIVRRIASDDPRVHLLHNPERRQSAALNIGIAAASGDIVVRADCHATYGPQYVSKCVAHLESGAAENVGGLQRGSGNTPFSRAVSAALNTRLGAGGAAYRCATKLCYADTVWLGAWYRSTLVDLGGYDLDMVANEDYELNWRLRERGGRVLVDPSLESTYYPRTGPVRLWRQYFGYGAGKFRMLCKHPRSVKLRQLVPVAFVAALALCVGLAPATWLPLAALCTFYATSVVLGTVEAAWKQPMGSWPLVPAVLVIMHLAWGCGFLWHAGERGLTALRPRPRPR